MMHQVRPDYTLVSALSATVPESPTPTFATAKWEDLASKLPPYEHLRARTFGDKVVHHRSSWVNRMRADSLDAFIKTYEYSSWGDKLGNCAKWTAPLRHSRAVREWLALRWLNDHELPTVKPLACWESRRFGFVEHASILTATFDGEAADQVFANANEAKRKALATAIGAFVVTLHGKGFRDRNLDLRNLLIRQGTEQIHIAKIDSPRFQLVRPQSPGAGSPKDRLANADWQRLLPQLAKFDVANLAAKSRDARQ